MPTIPEMLTEVRRSWDDAPALARLGRELEARNRLDHAREALERALELDPKVSADAWIYLSFAWFRDFEAKKGYETLRRGIEVMDSDEIRTTLIGFSEDEEEQKALHAAVEGTTDPAALADLEFGTFWEGDDEAVARVRAMYEANPGHEGIRSTYSFLLLSARRQGRAGVDLKKEGIPVADAMIRDHPDRSPAYATKIQMLQAEEDHEGVLAATEEALARFPDDETLMQLRAAAYAGLLDHDRAKHWYARAIGAKPTFAGARRDLGKLWEKEGKLDLAEEIFREIPKANPDYAIGPMSLALFLARQERFEEAERITAEAWPKLPRWAQGSLRNQPDAAPLFEREALKDIVTEKE